MQEPYQLIDCDLYDELIALIMQRQPCSIRYRNNEGQETSVQDQLIDVYSQEHQEFLRLKGGTVIRLDHLIAVNCFPFQD